MIARRALLLCSVLAVAAQDSPPAPDRVNKAIDAGARWLKDMAKTMGYCNQTQYEHSCTDRKHLCAPQMGHHELVLLTLLHAGEKTTDETMKQLIERVAKSENESTYRVALKAMCLKQIGGYKKELEACAKWLGNNQCANGQWCYSGKQAMLDKQKRLGATPQPDQPVQEPWPGDFSFGDHSNSQYAALGLRACADAGIAPDKGVLERAKRAWESTQQADGGWGYSSHQATNSYGSMTAGAIASLCILDHLLQQDRKKNPAIAKGLKWLADNWAVDKNPRAETAHIGWEADTHLYYHLYAIERVGALYDTEKIGPHAWYAQGAKYLLKEQKDDGSWDRDVVKTCFAILFLKRATATIKTK